MGRTIPSFRMILESEIGDWKKFGQALRPDEKEHFEMLMNACREYASCSGAACRPIPSEAMFMSMILAQQKELSDLRSQVKDLKQRVRWRARIIKA